MGLFCRRAYMLIDPTTRSHPIGKFPWYLTCSRKHSPVKWAEEVVGHCNTPQHTATHCTRTNSSLQTSPRDIWIWKETYIHQKRPMCIKRNIRISKQTYVYQKRPPYMKRDLCVSKETSVYQKRPKCIKRNLRIWKEPFYSHALWPSTNGAIPYFLVLPGSELSITEITEITEYTFTYMKRDMIHTHGDMHVYQTRPPYIKKDLGVSKETSAYQKSPCVCIIIIIRV